MNSKVDSNKFVEDVRSEELNYDSKNVKVNRDQEKSVRNLKSDQLKINIFSNHNYWNGEYLNSTGV